MSAKMLLILAMMTVVWILYSAESQQIPCAHSSLNAYKVCAHELMTLRTCSDIDKLFVIVIPRVFIVKVRSIPGIRWMAVGKNVCASCL